MRTVIATLSALIFAIMALSPSPAEAWLNSFWYFDGHTVRIAAINPWGDLVFYPMLVTEGDDDDDDDGMGSGLVLVEEVTLSDVRPEVEGLVGHFEGVTADGVYIAEDHLLSAFFMNGPDGSLVTADDVYLGATAGGCD